MTEEEDQVMGCSECTHLKLDILKQLGAYKVLASLNPKLDASILIQNIKEVIAKYGNPTQNSVSKSSSSPLASKQQQQIPTLIEQKETSLIDTMDEPALQRQLPANTSSPSTPTSSSAAASQSQDTSNNTWQEKCLDLLKAIQTRDDAKPFLQPSQSSSMCLEKIEKNLLSEKYEDVLEFHKDVLEIFLKVKVSNPDLNSPVRTLAKSLETYYHTVVQSLLESTSPSTTSPTLADTDLSPICLKCQRKFSSYYVLNKHDKMCRGNRPRIKCPKKTDDTNSIVQTRPKRSVSVVSQNSVATVPPVGIVVPPSKPQKVQSGRKRTRVHKVVNKPKMEIPGKVETHGRPKKRKLQEVKQEVYEEKQCNEEENLLSEEEELRNFMKKHYPTFDLERALSARIKIDRLASKEVMVARLRIKNTVPGYKKGKWARGMKAKQKMKVIAKQDRITGLFTTPNPHTAATTTTTKRKQKKLTLVSLSSVRPPRPSIPVPSWSEVKPGTFRPVHFPSLPDTEVYKYLQQSMPSVINDDEGKDDTEINFPVAAAIPPPPPDEKLTLTQVNGDLGNDDSMLVISCEEAAAFGINPFEEVQEEEIIETEMVVDDLIISETDVNEDISTQMTQNIEEQSMVVDEMTEHFSEKCHEEEEEQVIQNGESGSDETVQVMTMTTTVNLPIEEEEGKNIDTCSGELETQVIPMSEVKVDERNGGEEEWMETEETNEVSTKLVGVKEETDEVSREELEVNEETGTENEDKVVTVTEIKDPGDQKGTTYGTRSDDDVWSKIRRVPKGERNGTNKHLGPFSYVCTLCEESFDYKNNAMNHIRKVHPIIQRVKCLDCDRDVTDIRGFWKHQAICKAAQARAKAEEEAKMKAKEEEEADAKRAEIIMEEIGADFDLDL